MLKRVILILAIFCISCATTVHLNVTPIKQKTRFWCWSTTLAMVGRYYKAYPIRQCDIVGSNNLTATGKILGSTKCCIDDTPAGARHYMCYRAGQIWDMILTLDKVLKLRYEYIRRPLSREELITHLKKKHLIISLRKMIGNGHANLIIGYDKATDIIAIAEPTPGTVIYVKYKKYIASLKEGIWEESIVITDKPATAPMCAMKCIDNNCVFKVLDCLPNQ
jgi:hypothetical protein